MFSFDDATLDPDMLVQESDLLTFMVDFFDPTDTLISSYDLTNQFNDFTGFSFNFNFEANTGIVRQSGIADEDFSILIGDFGPGEVAFLRQTACSDDLALFNAPNCGAGLDGGGEAIATPKPVPEPASALGLALVAGLGTVATWKKRDIASKTEK